MDGSERRDGVSDSAASAGLPSRPEAGAELPHRGMPLQRGGRVRSRGARGAHRGAATNGPRVFGPAPDAEMAMAPLQGGGRGRGRGRGTGRMRPRGGFGGSNRATFRGGRGRGGLPAWLQPQPMPEQLVEVSFPPPPPPQPTPQVVADLGEAPIWEATEQPSAPEELVEHLAQLSVTTPQHDAASTASSTEPMLSPRVPEYNAAPLAGNMGEDVMSPRGRRWSQCHRPEWPAWPPVGPPYEALEPVPFLALDPARLPPPPPPPPPGPFTLWLPVPYLVYWGPEPLGAHPHFYDVPMFAEDL